MTARSWPKIHHFEQLTKLSGGVSNSGPAVKLSVNVLAGSRVLSAVGTCPSA
jgi:hypothetical protein